MMDLAEYPELLIALIGLLGIAAQWLSWWLKLPAIVLLLLAGVIGGPLTGLVDPDALLGDLLFPFVSLGVAVILFEGSLTLRVQQIRGLEGAVRNLVTVGALITWLMIGVAARYLLGLPWELALLFGALVTVTGPTVIGPMLRTVRPNARIAQVLRWEGIIIDPLGALLAVLVFEFIASGTEQHTVWVFTTMLVVGSSSGAAAAYVLAAVLRRHLLPDYLRSVATLALVLGVFSISNTLQHESGLLAVTVMGLLLANMKDLPVDDILDFKEDLSILFISALFIVLAARIDFSRFQDLGYGALYLLAVIVLLVRPLAVFVSTLRSELTWRERVMIAWIGPRGIVAAAIASLFVIKLERFGYTQSYLLVPLTFMVIVGTVMLQSITARPLARLLGVSEPVPRGVLIVGANRVARAVAAALAEQGYRSVVADTSWTNIREARMAGLDTYFGNVVSAHADRHLDLIGIGRLFAMSPWSALNALACIRYRSEFGTDAVFSLHTSDDDDASKKRTVSAQQRALRLFGEDVSYKKLTNLINAGGKIRATLLSETFDFADYCQQYQDAALLLFALDAKQRLHVATGGQALQPEPGWTVISLLPAKFQGQARSGRRDGGGDPAAVASG